MRAALVALALVGGACGPRIEPQEVGLGPTAPPREAASPAAPATADRPARAVLIGEMCPDAAGGRPAVSPWFVRQVGWRDHPDDAAAPIGRGAARQFSVLAHDGRRAGLFSAIGLAEVDDAAVAAGGYAGASPCAGPAVAGAKPELDPACVRVQRECGVAIAELASGGLAPVGEDPDPIALDVGGACVAGGDLVVDVDGDGRAERFPLDAFLDGDGPAEEIVAREGEGPACDPRFSHPELVPASHPRGFQGLDLLAVVDADADGRKELVLQLRYAGRRTAALYAARDTAARLDRVGEAVARPAR